MAVPDNDDFDDDFDEPPAPIEDDEFDEDLEERQEIKEVEEIAPKVASMTVQPKQEYVEENPMEVVSQSQSSAMEEEYDFGDDSANLVFYWLDAYEG